MGRQQLREWPYSGHRQRLGGLQSQCTCVPQHKGPRALRGATELPYICPQHSWPNSHHLTRIGTVKRCARASKGPDHPSLRGEEQGTFSSFSPVRHRAPHSFSVGRKGSPTLEAVFAIALEAALELKLAPMPKVRLLQLGPPICVACAGAARSEQHMSTRLHAAGMTERWPHGPSSHLHVQLLRHPSRRRPHRGLFSMKRRASHAHALHAQDDRPDHQRRGCSNVPWTTPRREPRRLHAIMAAGNINLSMRRGTLRRQAPGFGISSGLAAGWPRPIARAAHGSHVAQHKQADAYARTFASQKATTSPMDHASFKHRVGGMGAHGLSVTTGRCVRMGGRGLTCCHHHQHHHESGSDWLGHGAWRYRATQQETLFSEIQNELMRIGCIMGCFCCIAEVVNRRGQGSGQRVPTCMHAARLASNRAHTRRSNEKHRHGTTVMQAFCG